MYDYFYQCVLHNLYFTILSLHTFIFPILQIFCNFYSFFSGGFLDFCHNLVWRVFISNHAMDSSGGGHKHIWITFSFHLWASSENHQPLKIHFGQVFFENDRRSWSEAWIQLHLIVSAAEPGWWLEWRHELMRRSFLSLTSLRTFSLFSRSSANCTPPSAATLCVCV